MPKRRLGRNPAGNRSRSSISGSGHQYKTQPTVIASANAGEILERSEGGCSFTNPLYAERGFPSPRLHTGGWICPLFGVSRPPLFELSAVRSK